MISMGYYNQFDEEKTKKPSGNKLGYFFSGFIGAIIGAMLFAIIFPHISGGFLNQNEMAEKNIEQSNEAGNEKNLQNVSLNVTTDITEAVAKSSNAVVGITNIRAQSFWSQTQEAGTGSGVIYKKADGKAFIVTNNHVIQQAEQLEVTLADGTKEPAKLLGTDKWTDLAVVEIDGKNVDTVAEFGDSDALKAGEPVIAIGNPLGLQFSGSVTQGIVSATERTVPVDVDNNGLVNWQAEVIQTDAAINPGNSGGALINIAGQVVGINSMKIAQSAVEGIGFSIPINYAQPIIQDLETYGEIKRPSIGVTLRNVNEIPAYHQQETLKLPKDITEGVMIERVSSGSAAEQAGLQEFDVIVELDGNPVNNAIELKKYLYDNKKIGDDLKVKIYRAGKVEEITVKLSTEGQV